MNRWAVRVSLALVLIPTVAAQAAPPVPKPRPVRDAQADPQGAISRMMSGDAVMLGPAVAAYAPSSPGTDIRPSSETDVALYLVGKLALGGGPIGEGLTWRIFREFPGADGELPLVQKAEGGDLDVRLKPGRYIVHCSYGRASLSRTISLSKRVNSETFVLNAGGLQLAAILDEAERPVSDQTEFELFRVEGDERHTLGNVRAGAIARLPAGAYHVISKYGAVNAVRTADVKVEAGKLTRVTLAHQAGTVRLKLVRDANGEALADTAWTVYTEDGQQVFARVGAHANVTLAAGGYDVVARHRNIEFRQHFQVRSGDESDVAVVAQKL